MVKTKATKVQVSPIKSSLHSALSTRSSISSSSVKATVVQQDLPQTGIHVSEPIVPLILSIVTLVILLCVKYWAIKRSDR